MVQPERLTPLSPNSDSAETELRLQQCQVEYGVVGARLITLQGWARRVSQD